MIPQAAGSAGRSPQAAGSAGGSPQAAGLAGRIPQPLGSRFIRQKSVAVSC